MYQAKDAGRNTYRFFTQAMNHRAEERMVLESALRSALEQNQFSVAYQPIIDLGSGAVIGAEALLRWQQPELGLIPPSEFIPVAEETGLIEPIGAWVLKHVCAQMRHWNCAALAPLHVGVNFSSAQCRAETLKTLVMGVLKETGLPAEWLTLELTESLLIQDTPEIIETLQSLKDMGIKISIDDFGTGYSSLSYLKRFPVDVLKIERSFVRDISTDSSDRALCKAIIAMAHALNLTVIAEGVETEEQLAFLKACECDMAQGFYFSKPLEPAQFEILIGNKATRDRSPDTQRQLG
jgi:EAL domain-containing protein (putative c-di-GMP-specific phosphodiesterase class I)